MSDTATLERVKTVLKPPVRYRVILHNDNVTTFDFVTFLLMEVFNHDMESAKTITLQVHQQGAGIAGIYSKQVAEQKIKESNDLCNQFGVRELKITMEESPV